MADTAKLRNDLIAALKTTEIESVELLKDALYSVDVRFYFPKAQAISMEYCVMHTINPENPPETVRSSKHMRTSERYPNYPTDPDIQAQEDYEDEVDTHMEEKDFISIGEQKRMEELL